MNLNAMLSGRVSPELGAELDAGVRLAAGRQRSRKRRSYVTHRYADPDEVRVSVLIPTMNEERNLPRCLKSVAPLVDEIVVVDSGSVDATQEIAEKFSARIVHQDWLGYVGQKNFALDQATHSWVLSIDADEEISPELAAAIAKGNSPGAAR